MTKDTPKSDRPDSGVIRRALDGDERAYREIVKKYKGPLTSTLYKMVRNRVETEDLVQEAFIKAFKALGSFNDEYAFSTWLYKIAVNNCIDHLRKKRLRTYSMDNPVTSAEGQMQREFPDMSYSPERTYISREKTRIIEDAIQSLPEPYKTVIILRHSEDKAYEEIAQELQVPLGTVKARIFRAREMLKKRLKRDL